MDVSDDFKAGFAAAIDAVVASLEQEASAYESQFGPSNVTAPALMEAARVARETTPGGEPWT